VSIHKYRAQIFASFVAFGFSCSAWAIEPPDGLKDKIQALDGKLFGAYNSCDLKTMGSLFDENVEFYHDTGGATFDRQSVLDSTQKFICGKVRRELLTETLRVFPIEGFGAIEEGEHQFCDVKANECQGIAKFVIVWSMQGDEWRITRVLSYGHRALPPPTGASAVRPQ
jgi:hypothetical protein